ncbi:MAG: hypothetical protein GY869_20820 [Planctomycetes bacterium]|nr:hypothetical protein [Planctomycetota bacterium]
MRRGLWGTVGVVGLLGMVVMVWPIVFGISRSPHHGGLYVNSRTGEPEKRNGYVQKMDEVRARKRGGKPMWEVVAEMVGERSEEDDTLYVWGWYPGIYVMSQRDSASNEAVYGNMHSDPPEAVGRTIEGILNRLEAQPPKFMVDSQKSHYPYYDHPNFYLWPSVVASNQAGVYMTEAFHASQKEAGLDWVEQISYTLMTAPNHANGPIEESRARELAQMERARHKAMLPLREFVMQNYEPIFPQKVSELGSFNSIRPREGLIYVFQRKDNPGR